MSLNYLDFEFSDDTEGVSTFEAMASVGPSQIAAVQGEVAQVLGWAFDAFGGSKGAVSDGFDWDYDLQAQAEYTASENWQFDPAMGLILTSRQAPGRAASHGDFVDQWIRGVQPSVSRALSLRLMPAPG